MQSSEERNEQRQQLLRIVVVAAVASLILVFAIIFRKTHPIVDQQSLPIVHQQNPPVKDKPVHQQSPPVLDKDIEQFRVFVRQHAQDPDGFEILSWGDKKGKSRTVRFRCKVIAIATEIRNGPFYRPGGSPISVDTATLTYSDAGKIVSCYLSEGYRFWRQE